MGSSIRIVDCIAHQFTGVQMLEQLARIWKEQPAQTAVILKIGRGEAAQVKNTIRVALSRERKARQYPRTFELRFSAPIECDYYPPGDENQVGECLPAEMLIVNRVQGSVTTVMQSAFQRILTTKGKTDG